jgi:hypothetical protein
MMRGDRPWRVEGWGPGARDGRLVMKDGKDRCEREVVERRRELESLYARGEGDLLVPLWALLPLLSSSNNSRRKGSIAIVAGMINE